MQPRAGPNPFAVIWWNGLTSPSADHLDLDQPVGRKRMNNHSLCRNPPNSKRGQPRVSVCRREGRIGQIPGNPNDIVEPHGGFRQDAVDVAHDQRQLVLQGRGGPSLGLQSYRPAEENDPSKAADFDGMNIFLGSGVKCVSAETVLTMRQTSGEGSTLLRDTAAANDVLADLRRAEAVAEIICF